tara:strand:- start:394 stop:663 length:270 start_codon:yes stop_codon:yes gene_type:complete
MTKRKKLSRTIIPLFQLSNNKFKTKFKTKFKKKCNHFEIHSKIHKKIHKKKYKLSKVRLDTILRNIEKIKISYLNSKNAKNARNEKKIK